MILSSSAAATLMLSIVLWYLLTQFTRRARLLNKFPGPLTLPFIGGTYLAVWARGHKIQACIEKALDYYGNTGRLWLGHKPLLFTRDLELIEKILSSTVHTEKISKYKEGGFFVGTTAVVTSPPHIWKHSRKAVVPSFYKSMLESYMDTFNQHANLMIKILDKKFLQNPNDFMDLHPSFCRSSLDIISDCIWDDKLNFQSKPELRLYETLMACSSLAGKRVMEPWILAIPFFYKLFGYEKHEKKLVQRLHEIFPDEFLQQQRKYFAKKQLQNEPTKKYMALLCTKEKSLSDEDLYYEIITIFFAGMDTSSTCLAIVLFMLGNHKNIQEKVFAEIQSQLGTDWRKDISMEDLKRLPYMDLVIKESLRICTPLPTIGRNTCADIVLSNGLVVPKGTDIFLSLHAVHNDPTLYPKPKEFIPERFLDATLATRNPYGYLVFSKGPRNCLGMQFGTNELKLMLIKVLMKFTVDSANRLEDQHFHFNFVVEPIGGLKIKLTQRK